LHVPGWQCLKLEVLDFWTLATLGPSTTCSHDEGI
jgi:hypothetical protein